MSYVVETWTTEEGYQATLRVDEDSYGCNPRDWDNLGTMACWHRRYELGDEQPDIDPQDYLAGLPEGTIVLPLYLYDHSGITMSTSPFSCPWDSGQVGFIYVTPDTLTDEWLADRTEQQIRDYLVGEVQTYDYYLRGEVYYYTVEKPSVCDHGDTHWETMDSCGGYPGYDNALREAKFCWPEAELATA